MNNIKKLYREWLSVQPLNPDLKRKMDQQFMIDFNYNSNHLEGNTLTYGQTKLLLLFGDTIGNASMQHYEEMKAHNVGLEMMKIAALDKDRPLSESFIRELNKTILVRDFWKTSKNGDYRYKIKVGVYKTRPNSVITPTGEEFHYASPEETPALMSDLVRWYNTEELKAKLSPAEIAALFHYRYIRIHPFEDGNGRIARLMVNYILLRHGYPMIVVRTDDRSNYLKVLHQSDLLTGTSPSDGAHATLEQAKPLVEYIADIVEKKLTTVLQLIKGEIKELMEAKDDTVKDDTVKGGQKRWSEVLNLIKENPSISYELIVKETGYSRVAVRRYIQTLKKQGFIERIGSNKIGYWKIIAENEPENEPESKPENDPISDPINDPISDPISDPINDPINDPVIATINESDNYIKIRLDNVSVNDPDVSVNDPDIEENSGTIAFLWWYNDSRVTINNVNQQRIIETLIMDSTISIRDISEIIKINKSAIQKHLAVLKEKGYIFRKGGTKGEWIVNLKQLNDEVVQ